MTLTSSGTYLKTLLLYVHKQGCPAAAAAACALQYKSTSHHGTLDNHRIKKAAFHQPNSFFDFFLFMANLLLY